MPYARSLRSFAGPAKGLAMQGQNCPERQIICVGVSGNDKRPALIPGYAMPPDRVRWFAVNRRTGMFADSRWGVGPAFPYRNACHHVLRRTLPTAWLHSDAPYLHRVMEPSVRVIPDASGALCRQSRRNNPHIPAHHPQCVKARRVLNQFECLDEKYGTNNPIPIAQGIEH